jgi:hypothetical protein
MAGFADVVDGHAQGSRYDLPLGRASWDAARIDELRTRVEAEIEVPPGR